MVGEMSVRGNALVGKCPVGEVSFGEVSGRGIVRSGKCPSGKCPSGKCPSGKCLSGICPQGSVRSGNCPTIEKRTSPFIQVILSLVMYPVTFHVVAICFLKELIFVKKNLFRVL